MTSPANCDIPKNNELIYTTHLTASRDTQRVAMTAYVQVGTFEVATFEVGTFEAGTFEVGTFEVGTFEVRTFEVRTFELPFLPC